MHPFHKRLLKEFKSLNKNQLPNIKILTNNETLTNFDFEIEISNELYDDKFYKLVVVIVKDYPVLPPKAKFVVGPRSTGEVSSGTSDNPIDISSELSQTSYKIPIHPHIYSNGHICLNLLGDDWTPACTIESILISLQSMINNNGDMTRPPDDNRYIKYAGEFASKDGFLYHDDSV